ncbi:hypothetical protein [Vitiosangium sp. GDMCC 1.1324]|uniref:hypothetical protein n=1 Tax=Vitiosangium sp. (strain GDMCC 1.1324) TaxID=2138576 RepID=UPI000D3C23A1|nr:hypothetical protein [Vitiosangium sp. GDMCC 1.1324]PTL82609.1 hypothetical protein DAT35_17585 [Vitiosangium sp. GDMCC 1.1324]
MNVKTMAAIVGTLSLGSLATGCATAKPAAATSEAKGTEASCKGGAEATQEKGGEAKCSGKAASTSEKGSEHGCGKDGCGAAKPQ